MSINVGEVYSTVGILCIIFQAFKLLFLASYTGFSRRKTGVAAAPEDQKLLGTSGGGDSDMVDRAKRVHYNELENTVPFVLSYFAFSGFLADWMAYLFIILVVCWILARVGYTVSYILAKQPFRSIFFLISVVILLLMLVMNLVNVIYVNFIFSPTSSS
eukprot:TRINITY_DN48293_c0_g1_i1.p1 TRINITY_DN48293_c0_g1~~TRINITY_DN48293_c0_g1_i1.p1  ORF type:complete len:159 (-),score=29.83 TRINITY_DN48293_c0_g1_i1:14-490(-)